jgi:hypothetical protein
MLTHDGRVSPVIIPTGHMGEESGDPFLHKILISFATFTGKDNGAIQSYLQDILAEIYEELLLNSDEGFIIQEDFVDIIATTIVESSTTETNITLKNTYPLYMME